ncbi:MAG: hypothetical protein HPZ86_07330 [Clostridia bacterium]|nr:hypothetical protein [Clostridia bacterium]
MNKESASRNKKHGDKNGRIRDILLLSALALLLVFAVWKIFYTGYTKNVSGMTSGSESEQRLCSLLKEIDGVGEVNVMICESEDGVESVVVVCEGANDLRVNMNIREAVAAALGTDEKSVKIYLMKE